MVFGMLSGSSTAISSFVTGDDRWISSFVEGTTTDFSPVSEGGEWYLKNLTVEDIAHSRRSLLYSRAIYLRNVSSKR